MPPASGLTAAALRTTSGTTITDDTVLEDIIVDAEAEANAYLRRYSFSVSGVEEHKTAVKRLAMAGIIRYHRVRGERVQTVLVGDRQTSDDPEAAIAALRKEAYDILNAWVSAQTKPYNYRRWVLNVGGR